MTARTYETHFLDWRETRIEVRYSTDYCRVYRRFQGHPLAHLELRSVAPPRQPLPVTETGYFSHFTTPDVIDQSGGPVAFVQAALEMAAETDAWREQEAAARQYSLL